ncbi:MAG: hypothetical protein WC477_07335 [Patescibacteria group bacterium]
MPKLIAREPKKPKPVTARVAKRVRVDFLRAGGKRAMANRKKTGTFIDFQSSAGKARMSSMTKKERLAFARAGADARARKRLERELESKE